MTDYLDDDKINKMIQSYKNGQAYRNKYYNNRYKTDEAFRENRLVKSREYYSKIRSKKLLDYRGVNGERIRAYRRWNYAKEKGITDRYKWKYPEDYELYIKGFFDK
tara:strand:+ start:215 stop:532 length:318 start_codon:yes stop_codon:yes gene_type:complete